MIATLRRRHRWMTVALLVALPLLYLLALLARPEPPRMEAIPAELVTGAEQPPPSGERDG